MKRGSPSHRGDLSCLGAWSTEAEVADHLRARDRGRPGTASTCGAHDRRPASQNAERLEPDVYRADRVEGPRVRPPAQAQRAHRRGHLDRTPPWDGKVYAELAALDRAAKTWQAAIGDCDVDRQTATDTDAGDESLPILGAGRRCSAAST